VVPSPEPKLVDRYQIHGTIGSGGMATVHIGRFVGPGGFARTVAIKRMHPHLAKEPEFVAMFLDEARLAARIRHPNVVSTLDVLARSGELLIVMEYVHGESLGSLTRMLAERRERVPVPIACAIVADLLAGLHAAHEARDQNGEPLRIVHRDVSPQNALVGVDGVTRVLDFGVAKAVGRLQQTREGEVKGKIAYMAPEQVQGKPLTRATDIYAASVVFWEALTGKRLYASDRDADLVEKILFGTIDAPSARAPNVPEALNAVVLRGLSRDPQARFATAMEMARAIRECARPASPGEVGDWVEEIAAEALSQRAAAVAAIDRDANQTDESRASRRSLTLKVRMPEQAAVVLPAEAIGSDATILGTLPSPAKPRSSRRAVALALASVLLLVAAAAVVRASSPHTTAETVPSAVVPPAAALLPPPDPSEQSLPDPSASATAVTPVTPRVQHPTRPRPRADCTPPYTTDADGTRHYKLQCL
jgi:serine/threonine protein kinase